MKRDLIVAVRDLTVDFGDVPVLAGVDFELRVGDKVLVSGPSGAGKSVLLAAMTGTLAASAVKRGRFALSDRPDDTTAPLDYPAYCGAAAIGRFGMVFQDAMQSLHPYRSVHGQFGDGAADHLPQTFAQVRLDFDRFSDRRRWSMPHHCSGGERQRLSLALALAARRDVFFLDEPITDIDLISRRTVERCVRDLLDGPDRTVVLVTHDWDWIDRPIRHLRLDAGRLVPTDRGDGGAGIRARVGATAATAHQSGRPLRPPFVHFEVREPFAPGPDSRFRLWPLSFDLEERARIGIIGESGCGKTTLIRLMAGLGPRRTYGRSVRMTLGDAGYERGIESLPPRQRAAMVQLVHQDTTGTVIPNEGVGDHLERVRALKKAAGAEAFRARAVAAARQLGLIEDPPATGAVKRGALEGGDTRSYFAKPFASLSIGMRRRTSLLRAFMLLDGASGEERAKPKLLLLDEVSRGLDAANRQRMADAIADFSRTCNVAVVAVSHDLAFLSLFCTAYRVMFRGALLPGVLTPADVAALATGAAAGRFQNPYYHEFLSGEESPGEVLSGAADHPRQGCLYRHYHRCRHDRHGECATHRELGRSGAVGICQ